MANIKFWNVEHKVVKKVCDLIETLGYDVSIQGEDFILEPTKEPKK